MQDLTFNPIIIETEYGKSFKIALPVDNEKPRRGKRAKLPLLDDRFLDMDKEEFERILEEFIKLPN